VSLAERNDPIEALTPQGPDQSFTKRVRLRTTHRRGDHLKAEPGQRSVQFGGIDRVVVVDDETILVVEWDGISQLLQSPRGGGMGRRIEVISRREACSTTTITIACCSPNSPQSFTASL
jgi:hypothetical protein